MLTLAFVYGQSTYYWVGGASGNWTSASSWNTQLNGSGSSRSTANTMDRLIIDGSNIGGGTAATGTVTPNITSSVAFGQLALQNNATLVLQRASSGTSTFTINGDGTAADDLTVDATSTLSITNNISGQSFVLQLGVTGTPATGKINGTVTVSGTSTGRLVVMNAASLSFESGSNANVNMTAASSYPFGSATQAVEKAIIFQAGANLNYLGGFSPMGNQQAYSAIDFRPGSNWYHKVSNPASSGSFFNTKSFGNIIVENGATLAADGPIYKIDNLTVQLGGTFITHTSGQTAVLGNMTVNGTYTSQTTTRSNVLVLGGNTPQTVSGTGTITIPSLMVAANADVSLQMNITALDSAVNVYGKINFNNYRLSGEGTFTSRVNGSATSGSGALTAGSYQITGVSSIGSVNGLFISGAGIAPNTAVVGFSTSNATISLSQPILSSGTNVALTYYSDTAVLATSHPNGMDSLNGSVTLAGTKNYQNGTNYIINGATSWPFGVTSGSTSTYINAGFVVVNAPVTVNRGVHIYSHLTLNNKLTLRSQDTMRIMTGAGINRATGNANYIATGANAVTGELGVLQYDYVASSVLLPVGSPAHYLPVTITPSAAGVFTVSAFEGITSNGNVNGTPLTAQQKQTVVDAMWHIYNPGGSGSADIQLAWDASLEGATFTTLPGSDIGIIYNDGTSFSLPLGTGDNVANTASANVSSFGAFSVGAIPLTDPFIFNEPPVKTYGDADFNGGATSLNTTEPIVYTSSNPAVATIVSGNIHITGAGTTTITASQATDGFYPAASVSQTLTVNKAALTITADNKTKVEGDALPALTVTYAGFVYGETPAVLLTPVTVTTTATAASPAGTYPIVPAGATSNNYSIQFVNGTLTVQPRLTQTITFNELPVKVYGNASFPAAATSTNSTIPITYSSSNTAVATISGGNIQIVGAGTAIITASQAGNVFYYPAADVSRTLTVNRAALTIRVRDTTKVQGEPNPVFTITYTGFVNGNTPASLTSQPTAVTSATTNSAPGYYTVVPEGAASPNYNITTVAGRLTILPLSGVSGTDLNAYMSNSTTLTVRTYVAEPALADIVLYDISGKPLLKRNIFMPVGFRNYDIPVGSLPSGIYVVTVRGGKIDLRKTIRIIK